MGLRSFLSLPLRLINKIKALPGLAEIEAKLDAAIQHLRDELRDHQRDQPTPQSDAAIGQERFAQIEAKLSLLLERQDHQHRETRLALTHLLLPHADLWLDGTAKVGVDIEVQAFNASHICRKEHFDAPYYRYWMERMDLAPIYHRKNWEFAFIIQALYQRGILKPGARGLGFGVGQERLSALFASMDVQITGTDMIGDLAVEAGWTATNEHAAGKESLRHPSICPDGLFDANVEFKVCDMNAVPEDFTGYDFCWSACALEHLGSIELGLAFIERSLKCLKPGGLAIHTTEFNIDSDDATVDNMGTVLFRRRDLMDLQARVEKLGAVMAPLDLNPGRSAVDQYLDLPPYRYHPHLRLALEGYATTSVGVIIRAPL